MNRFQDHTFKKNSVSLVAVSFFVLWTADMFAAEPRRRFWQRTPVPEVIKAVNSSETMELVGAGSKGPAVLRAQILLERAGFSPGEIDDAFGSNVRKAISEFQKQQGLTESGSVDPETWTRLNEDNAPVLVPYIITADDVRGPFVKVPRRMMAKAKLSHLGYQSLVEALGERFHINPDALRRLNRGKTFKAGDELFVPDFSGVAARGKVTRVVVDKSDLSLRAFDANEKLLAFYPVTVGGKQDPLPIGTWKVLGVAKNPVYNYNPKLFWDAESGDTKAKIAPGPNNPVGLVWIALSKRHYGIHGTPEPSTIGKTFSHGCIRLANWSATELAGMISPGVVAILQE